MKMNVDEKVKELMLETLDVINRNVREDHNGKFQKVLDEKLKNLEEITSYIIHGVHINSSSVSAKVTYVEKLTEEGKIGKSKTVVLEK